MADKPINQAPEQSAAMYSVYVRKNSSTNDLTQVPENQFAHAVGLSASDVNKVPYINSSGDFTRTGSSTTDGDFLGISGGVPVWTPNSSAFTLLSTQTASAAASINFSSGFSSTYDDYVFEFRTVRGATSGTTLRVQLSQNGGSSFRNLYDVQVLFDPQALTTTVAGGDGGTNNYASISTTMPTETEAGINGKLFLSRRSTYASARYLVDQLNTSQRARMLLGSMRDIGGGNPPASPVDYVRFVMSSGNINGTISMYGIKK